MNIACLFAIICLQTSNFHFSYLFTSCLNFYNLYEFGSQYLTELLSIFKVCESVLPQGFSLRQGLWVSSSTGLLPMPSFVGFFFHRTFIPNAKFRGFLLPQDFISQCQGLWVSSSTGLLPTLRFRN